MFTQVSGNSYDKRSGNLMNIRLTVTVKIKRHAVAEDETVSSIFIWTYFFGVERYTRNIGVLYVKKMAYCHTQFHAKIKA